MPVCQSPFCFIVPLVHVWWFYEHNPRYQPWALQTLFFLFFSFFLNFPRRLYSKSFDSAVAGCGLLIPLVYNEFNLCHIYPLVGQTPLSPRLATWPHQLGPVTVALNPSDSWKNCLRRLKPTPINNLWGTLKSKRDEQDQTVSWMETTLDRISWGFEMENQSVFLCHFVSDPYLWKKEKFDLLFASQYWDSQALEYLLLAWEYSGCRCLVSLQGPRPIKACHSITSPGMPRMGFDARSSWAILRLDYSGHVSFFYFFPLWKLVIGSGKKQRWHFPEIKYWMS